MRKLALFALFLGTLYGTSKAQEIKPNIVDEHLQYDVMFKWGFIEKKAGEVNLYTKPVDNDEYFQSVLTGRSVDLADSYYTVRDTLLGKISKINLQPVSYERIAHEGGAFYRDKVSFFHDFDNVTGNATTYRVGRDGNEEKGEKLMTATGITLDMLSALYYTRYIDYGQMKPGESLVFNIFSGSKQERLKITYDGKTTVFVPFNDDESLESYHVSFSFTYTDHDQTKSSDPIEAWISTDSLRTPYQLTGKLPIGAIKCVLTNANISK